MAALETVLVPLEDERGQSLNGQFDAVHFAEEVPVMGS